MIYHSHDLYID